MQVRYQTALRPEGRRFYPTTSTGVNENRRVPPTALSHPASPKTKDAQHPLRSRGRAPGEVRGRAPAGSGAEPRRGLGQSPDGVWGRAAEGAISGS